jgi:hypothetical protein
MLAEARPLARRFEIRPAGQGTSRTNGVASPIFR